MEQEIHIILRYDLAIGKASLNEIVFKLQQIQGPLMLEMLKNILLNYDDLISDRLSTVQSNPPSVARKGLGQHVRKDDPKHRFCHGRRTRKRGYRNHPKNFTTVFGKFELPVRVAECCTCGARYSPLLSALKLTPYARKEVNFEHEVIEAVIDTNYRRLIDGRSIDISLGGVHNLVVGSDIDQFDQGTIDLKDLSATMADATGIKQQKGKKGELRAVIGITTDNKLEPLGTFINTDWTEIDNIIKERIKSTEASGIPFIYDGEPGLDNFLSNLTNPQRCTWHAPRGLYHALWEDGLRKKDSQPEMNKVKQLIGIELPETDFQLLKPEDKGPIEKQYKSSKAEIKQLIDTFQQKGYYHGASYLENLSQRLFTNIEIWLKSGVIAPKTISLLERIFREIGRRLKRIAYGWSDAIVTKLSKMIILKKYRKDKWEQYWKQKLGIEENFNIHIVNAEIHKCHNF